MATGSVTIIPLGKEPSLSRIIARCVKALEQFPSVKVHLTPMSTQLEGSVEDILNAAKAMHQAAFSEGVSRTYTTITIDDRIDHPVTLDGKLISLKEKIKL
jgi:uncharacterized protein (TIGR00106 family)